MVFHVKTGEASATLQGRVADLDEGAAAAAAAGDAERLLQADGEFQAEDSRAYRDGPP